MDSPSSFTCGAADSGKGFGRWRSSAAAAALPQLHAAVTLGKYPRSLMLTWRDGEVEGGTSGLREGREEGGGRRQKGRMSCSSRACQHPALFCTETCLVPGPCKEVFCRLLQGALRKAEAHHGPVAATWLQHGRHGRRRRIGHGSAGRRGPAWLEAGGAALHHQYLGRSPHGAAHEQDAGRRLSGRQAAGERRQQLPILIRLLSLTRPNPSLLRRPNATAGCAATCKLALQLTGRNPHRSGCSCLRTLRAAWRYEVSEYKERGELLTQRSRRSELKMAKGAVGQVLASRSCHCSARRRLQTTNRADFACAEQPAGPQQARRRQSPLSLERCRWSLQSL